MTGGAGDDTYYVDDAGDRVIEANGGGLDTVFSSVTFSLSGTYVENLVLTGEDAIGATGNSLDNQLTGNDEANLLSGAGGDDTLVGGLGADTLVGGLGADHYRYFSAVEGGDTVRGFVSGVDKIDISAAGFGGGLTQGGLASSWFVASTTGASTEAHAQLVYETDTGRLSWDADGTGAGAATLIATLSGHPSLTNSDFNIIA
ncbi:M10 family metallopeptidase C-terminal domain-containing protein [Roseomonas sp. SG15]|uniref:M10 family metallopeptidase C-terminal domain-containing protein n=2 Tax=Roseomonas indoligenes TaxID=2820811 RepID=A0A940N015_9PROT|nr:M10 family metallopeptidase C-terminal domain-containing protein [Pararoseomonas indoligenes]